MFFANVFFNGLLEKGEKIQYVLHRHPVLIYKKMLKVMFAGLLLPSLLFILFPVMKWGAFVWAFLGALKIAYLCMDWYFDAWLVTNQGVIVSEWGGFFNRSSSRIEFHTIEEVSYTVQGFWATVLRFGTLSIASFGGSHATTLKYAIRPKKMTRIIMKHQSKFMQKKTLKDHSALKTMISEMIQYTHK